ncbi:hypothetical protein ACFQFH_06825 [Halobaculum halobium]|uniref:hypothetical protein n=1 Tax=Halobaculum halobium TaxID=3032281 RepID=UPI003611EA37
MSALRGRVDATLRACSSHDDSDGHCDECGTALPATVHVSCEVCSEGGIVPPAAMVSHRTPFREALAAAGVDRLGYDAFAVTAGWPLHVVDGDEPVVEYDLPRDRFGSSSTATPRSGRWSKRIRPSRRFRLDAVCGQ